MKTTNNKNILNSIQQIYNLSKDSELKDELFTTIKKDLKIVSSYLKVESAEAFYFSIIIYFNFNGDTMSIKDLCNHLSITPIKLIDNLKYINSLSIKKIITKRNSRINSDGLPINKIYSVSNNITNAIMTNLPCPEINTIQINSTIDLIERTNELIRLGIEENLMRTEIYMQIESVLKEYADFLFVKEIELFELSDIEKIILYFITWKSICGINSISIDQLLNNISCSVKEKAIFIQSIFNSSNKLIKLNLLEIKKNIFIDEFEYSLGEKVIEKLEEDDILLFESANKKSKGIKTSEEITTKKLYYNSKEESQIDSLKSLLQEDKYLELKERLNSKSLPLSLNVLLFGSPGTGKTESVYQLAKKSGREIIKIDISKTKSKWFGESEKIIKNIFNDYSNYSKKCKLAPILLFNEADAILSTRTTNSESSTHQTENAIQNILLEELENFDGIFIATTNLVSNLDPAFDRRFLYKIEFSKPELAQRTNIWKEKLTHLSDNEYATLAQNFEFSGGQIENIVRKCEINYILKNESASIHSIIEYCKQENVINGNKNKNSIGF